MLGRSQVCGLMRGFPALDLTVYLQVSRKIRNSDGSVLYLHTSTEKLDTDLSLKKQKFRLIM